MKAFLLTLALTTAALSAEPQPLMITPGEVVVSREFHQESDVDKKWMKFRKETTYKVEDGYLKVIPPRIANKGTGKKSKWAASGFSRAGFVGIPKDYICRFRWKCNKPQDPRTLARGGVYIDLGHRCIRTTFSRRGTILVLENHLIGKDEKQTSKILQQIPELKLMDEKWYDILAEVKGNEVVVQIDGHVLYGNDDLILKDRNNTFNLDSNGSGYLLDRIEIRKAGGYQADWRSRREQLDKVTRKELSR